MADESTFLALLAAEPSDREVRLVYADWLEGQGRSQQARLLRLFDELVRTPYADAAFVKRSRALLGASRGLELPWLAAVSRPRLEGTCWGTRDHDGVPYLIGFLPAGQLIYRRPLERRAGGWGQIGTAIRFDINSHAEHVGAFVGASMRGTARNADNGTWNWQMARVDVGFLDRDFPDLPPEPMDTDFRAGNARDS